VRTPIIDLAIAVQIATRDASVDIIVLSRSGIESSELKVTAEYPGPSGITVVGRPVG
jgi:hypothetical protein